MKPIHGSSYKISALCLAVLISMGVSVSNAADLSSTKLLPPPAPTSMPDGQLPPPPADQGKDLSAFTAVALINGAAEVIANKSIAATKADENALLAKNHSSVTVTGSTITKTGDTTSGDGSNFNGQNAAVLAADSKLAISHSAVTTHAEGANAVFATGKNSAIKVNDVTIYTTKNSSRGLDATYDGTIIADKVSIKTMGAHCAAVATDRGEGTVIATNSSLTTYGEGSPCIYSTGNISVLNSTGTAYGSEIACVEGKNSITLDNVRLRGTIKHGVMLYQSFSGDADTGTASFTAINSDLVSSANGPMFYITNTRAKMYLENTKLTFANDTLVDVTSDHWGKAGANGGDFTLSTAHQQLAGTIKANNISSVAVILSRQSSYKGAINTDNKAKQASLKLDSTSQWTMTADAHLTSFEDEDATLSNIHSNGYTIYYKGPGTATKNLPGGGQLKPE